MASKDKKIVSTRHTLADVQQAQNKICGDGTIFPGTGLKKDPPRLPLGVFAVDYATGGGAPIWATTCLWGPEAGGKTSLAISAMRMVPKICWRCFKLFHECQCGEGPLRMKTFWCDAEGCIAEDQEIFDPYLGSLENIATFMTKENAWTSSWMKNGSLQIEQPAARLRSGYLETMLLQTRTTQLRATPTHPILTWRNGAPAWVELGDLSPGEYIARPWRIAYGGEKTGFSPDDGELVGMLLGDGSTTDSNNSVLFTNIDDDTWNRLETLVKPRNYIPIRFDERHGRLIQQSRILRRHSFGEFAPLKQWLIDLDIWNKTARHKKIPRQLLNSSNEIISALLCGLWMTDGHINKVRASATFSSSSKQLAVQVRWLLSRLGILGRWHEQVSWFTVTVNGVDNLKKFRNFIKLYGYKGAQLEHWCSMKEKQHHDSKEKLLPGYHNGKYYQKERWINQSDVWWDQITNISNSGIALCYDATVVRGHSWTVGDVIVHNTLDQEWAECIGAHPKDYHVGLGDYGEQDVNLVEAALRADDCGLVVLDGLAALVPAAEFEAPSEDQQIAMQTRLVGRCVRKIKQRLIKERKRGHPCAVIFTNQLRMIIGKMFGDPETMSGGHGMKHEFSLLLRCVKRSVKDEEKIKDQQRKKTLAQKHSFSIRKEKVLTLAGVGNYTRAIEDIPELDLKKGMVDDFKTVLGFAQECGIVKKLKASSYEYRGEKITKLQDIISRWKGNEDEYLSVQAQIIRAAKKEIRGG